MTSQKYKQTRSCEKCGYEETRFLDELTAAFEETRMWEKPCPSSKLPDTMLLPSSEEYPLWEEACPKCGSTEGCGESCEFPPLSRAQLEIWAINDELHFSQQDQDLILATPDNLELLLEFLDSPNTHIWQRRILASVLYVLWYDAYPETASKQFFTLRHDAMGECYLEMLEGYQHDAEFAKKVAKEINERTEMFIELGAEKSEEFGESLWYIGSYLREKFEK
jgi:hypothetical protein